MRRIIPALLIFWGVPVVVAAQTIEQRIAGVKSGTVHLSFAARPGICGDGGHNIRVDDHGDSEWERDCDPQLVRVALSVQNGRIVEIRSYVGGRWRPGMAATDLGTLRPQEAAAYLTSLAEREINISGNPVLPAALADSIVIWPALVRIARKPNIPEETRRTAVFWVGQAAGAAAAQSLDSIAGDSTGDREIRKHAVFALSQRPDRGVPALLRIARTNPDPEVRKSALFWLGQSEDPRALDLFEEILR
jgi:hypothetical protein